MPTAVSCNALDTTQVFYVASDADGLSVPAGLTTIAQRFNAGKRPTIDHESLVRTIESKLTREISYAHHYKGSRNPPAHLA
jgi:hypothetical protein